MLLNKEEKRGEPGGAEKGACVTGEEGRNWLLQLAIVGANRGEGPGTPTFTAGLINR